MVYFTSDLHFGHSGIITMQNRPFSGMIEMNRTLLRHYNALIQKDDTVYIPGDICHHLSLEDANNIIGKMNGKKILPGGNHADMEYNRKNKEKCVLRYDVGVDANQFCPVYQLLISICYLLVKGLLQTNTNGQAKLMDFMDEQRMCRLYEKFILEYYRKEFPILTTTG